MIESNHGKSPPPSHGRSVFLIEGDIAHGFLNPVGHGFRIIAICFQDELPVLLEQSIKEVTLVEEK